MALPRGWRLGSDARQACRLTTAICEQQQSTPSVLMRSLAAMLWARVPGYAETLSVEGGGDSAADVDVVASGEDVTFVFSPPKIYYVAIEAYDGSLLRPFAGCYVPEGGTEEVCVDATCDRRAACEGATLDGCRWSSTQPSPAPSWVAERLSTAPDRADIVADLTTWPKSTQSANCLMVSCEAPQRSGRSRPTSPIRRSPRCFGHACFRRSTSEELKLFPF